MPAIHLSGNRNITFVQIPKTAGTSVGHWLKEHASDDACMEWYNHPSPEMILATHEKNFTFTIVRNPWERIVSLYFFLKNWSSPHPAYRDSNELRKTLYRINNYDEFPVFEDWLISHRSFNFLPWIWWQIKTPQTTWAKDVDLVIKYEELTEKFKIIQDMFGTDKPLHSEVITRGIHWHDYHDMYNTETKNIVGKLFEEEIDLWKYTY